MKKNFLFVLLFSLLTSCSVQKWEEPPKSPYPTLPIGATSFELSPGTGENYEAMGTEPFWNVDITATWVVFSRPSETGTSTLSYETRQEERDWAIVIKDTKWEFFVTLKKWTCNDGMSEKKYYFTANVALGNENLKWCANKN